MRQWRPSTVTVPKHAHPMVRRLFEEMRLHQIGYSDLSERTGIDRNTIVQWRTRRAPSLANIEAALNAVGLEIVVRYPQ